MGFIDGICTHDQMVDLIIEKGSINDDEDWFREVNLLDYLDRPLPGDSLEGPETHFQQPEIAVIYVEGVIVDGNVDDGSMVGGQKIVDRIRTAWNDENCKAIVLRVNSPGVASPVPMPFLMKSSGHEKKGCPWWFPWVQWLHLVDTGLPRIAIDFLRMNRPLLDQSVYLDCFPILRS